MKLKREQLHEYQVFCIEFLLEHPIAGIFLDMGCGKSIITLTALWILALDYFSIGKTLIIAPKRVAEDTWSRELEKWEHLYGLQISKVLGTRQQREEALCCKADIYIINRENVAWLVEQHSWNFDTVVIDELSSFKSSKAQRFRALKKIRPKVRRIIGLTGTPAPNGLLDLWAQMYLLDLGERLGKWIGGYREQFFLPDKRNREVIFSYKPKEGAEEKIYERIGDICISMKAADYLELPVCIYQRVEVCMDKKEMAYYTQMERDMVLSIGEEELDAVHAATLSNKLLQMANGAVYDEKQKAIVIHDRKLEALDDLLEAANGKPLLIAYWYKHDRERIKKRVQAREINTTKDIADWNQGNIPIALIHPASGGHGLNLQEGGSALVWFGLTWSLELYQQMNARLFRQGQKHTVVITHLITQGTVDEEVMCALERKEVGQAALIHAVKARMGGAECEGRNHGSELS